jgi:hypothetical protein
MSRAQRLLFIAHSIVWRDRQKRLGLVERVRDSQMVLRTREGLMKTSPTLEDKGDKLVVRGR